MADASTYVDRNRCEQVRGEAHPTIFASNGDDGEDGHVIGVSAIDGVVIDVDVVVRICHPGHDRQERKIWVVDVLEPEQRVVPVAGRCTRKSTGADQGHPAFAGKARQAVTEGDQLIDVDIDRSETGGLQENVPRTDLSPEFAAIIVDAPVEKIVGPLLDRQGFTIVKPIKIVLGPSPALDNKVREMIEERVRRKKTNEQYERWIKSKRTRAMIDIRD